VREKVCLTCKQSKPLEEFPRRRASSDGLHALCRSCNSARARAYYAANRERHVRVIMARKAVQRRAALEAVGEHLLSHPCADCGEADIRVLDFDHREGVRKRAEVMKLAQDGYSVTVVMAEIAKCEVRCRNCHARVTYERMGDNWRSALMARAPADTRTQTGASEAGPPAA
jgi:hypothetical protein